MLALGHSTSHLREVVCEVHVMRDTTALISFRMCGSKETTRPEELWNSTYCAVQYYTVL
jgi:hypothetical protein